VIAANDAGADHGDTDRHFGAPLLVLAGLLSGGTACPDCVHPRFLRLEVGLHERVALLCTLVPSPRPLIQRDRPVGVVNLEVFVVQIVHVRVAVDGALGASFNLVEAHMPDDGAGRIPSCCFTTSTSRVHSVHHNSVNPSPWSSLSMHPVEHLLYWSDSLIQSAPKAKNRRFQGRK
jgi:hypothetical protein